MRSTDRVVDTPLCKVRGKSGARVFKLPYRCVVQDAYYNKLNSRLTHCLKTEYVRASAAAFLVVRFFWRC